MRESLWKTCRKLAEASLPICCQLLEQLREMLVLHQHAWTVAATTRKPFLEQLLRIGTTTCKLLYASPSFAIRAVVEQNFWAVFLKLPWPNYHSASRPGGLNCRQSLPWFLPWSLPWKPCLLSSCCECLSTTIFALCFTLGIAVITAVVAASVLTTTIFSVFSFFLKGSSLAYTAAAAAAADSFSSCCDFMLSSLDISPFAVLIPCLDKTQDCSWQAWVQCLRHKKKFPECYALVASKPQVSISICKLSKVENYTCQHKPIEPLPFEFQHGKVLKRGFDNWRAISTCKRRSSTKAVRAMRME